MDDKQFSGNSLRVNVKDKSALKYSSGKSVREKGLKIIAEADRNDADKTHNPEIYKPIPEDYLLPPVKEGATKSPDKEGVDNLGKVDNEPVIISTISENVEVGKMIQEDNINDGVDDQMLSAEDNGQLTEKPGDVQFIKGDHQNGDAKINVGSSHAKTFTGMSKEELMKYANDPFWKRIRLTFFLVFWAIWLAMLIGAVFIIIQAPKCTAPKPLPWYEEGPLVKLRSIEAVTLDDDIDASKKWYATGAIYELPPALTYRVKERAVQQEIHDIVAKYKDSDIHVILDITPNYVDKDSKFMRQALQNETKRSAFIWVEKVGLPNNWLSIVNDSAWHEIQKDNYVLSQFGDGLYDLHMNDSMVKKELGGVLTTLLDMGVSGFRLRNTKFFLLTKNVNVDEVSSNMGNYLHTEYGFWTHSQTTFQSGLGELLAEFVTLVRNTSETAMLSVADDMVRPEVYRNKSGDYFVDLPMYGGFTHSLARPSKRNLQGELENTLSTARDNNTWLQWNFVDVENSLIDPSAYAIFLSLLPGVPVIPADSLVFADIANKTCKNIKKLRSMDSIKYGTLTLYKFGKLVAYSRVKPGNPGYFVVLNPSNETTKANYGDYQLPDKMTVDTVSTNYNVSDITPKSKVKTADIIISPYASMVLTFVPV